MENQIIAGYANQGLGRLKKESLVHIISELRAMPTELAMKALENTPEYFGICSDAITRIDSAYKALIEGLERDVQTQLDSLARTKSYYEKDYAEAKTEEEKERYKSWMNEVDAKAQSVIEEAAKKRAQYFATHAGYILVGCSIAAVGIGGTIKFGKKFL